MTVPEQCLYGSNGMYISTHEDDPKIPEGFACLSMDNNGWVGTNNGWPIGGQPALFPAAQAEAIAAAWNSATKRIPAPILWPSVYSEEARKWLRWSTEEVLDREVQSQKLIKAAP